MGRPKKDAVKKEEKVGEITKQNYGHVVERADALRTKMEEHYHKHKGFPSLRFIIENWGFNISLKALCRHRAKVMEKLNIKHLGKPTHQLHRGKKEAMKAPVSPKPATVKAPKVVKEPEPVATTPAPTPAPETKTE